MLGGLADGIARRVGRLRRRRRVPTGPAPVKVNVGSGLVVAPGWIHVDGSFHALAAASPTALLRLLYRLSNTVKGLTEEEYVGRLKDHRFVHHELETGLPFENGSVDYLYSSHLLEHFFRSDAERLLRECLRVLRPGGVLRVAVPDLEHAVALYGQGRKQEALSYFFEGDEAAYYRRHRYMWDYELLEDALRAAGFRGIARRGYRDGAVPDLELLDNRPEETLFVEAAKLASAAVC